MEPDSNRLPERVRMAEAAIQKRLLAVAADQNYAMERQAIEDALANLRGLNGLRKRSEWRGECRTKGCPKATV